MIRDADSVRSNITRPPKNFVDGNRYGIEIETVLGIRIADALGRSFGGTFRLNVAVDETILGGFIARVRSRLIDASVASAIARFRKQGEETARA